jgi:nicotinate phosphoribosyltransferase
MNEVSCDNSLGNLLFTDLYELTMAQAFWAEGMEGQAVFELFFRKMPEGRNYMIAAGLDDALKSIEELRIGAEDLAYLRSLGLFSEPFLDRLKTLHFSGEVWAVPEGTVVFPNEPIVQVIAPIVEAQVIETIVLNQIQFPSLAASKAARMVSAAAGRSVIEFGARRAHSAEAALKVARAAYLVGATGTSIVLAGRRFGIPVFGTMAHSYIQSHEDEFAAFEAFARLYPETTLLVDTYDTLAGVRKVIALSHKLGNTFRIHAIRLDSGDLAALARQARAMLDAAGLGDVRIFASGGLDEHEIAALVAAGAPIDAFGVGTRLAVSEDAPACDIAYKLVEYNGRPRMKLSLGKVIYPSRKQVFRTIEDDRMVHDIIGRHDELIAGEPLLQCVMRGGRREPAGRVALAAARAHARQALDLLPEALRSLDPAEPPYPVAISPALSADQDTLLGLISH